ncbi:MAG: polysaccharide biosynthesis protein [Clostridia bacterium]|nr:polysaccharide biosynthesis protein [Clostridia bacterium]
MDHTVQKAPERNKKLFFSGVLFLGGANVLVKVIGLLFKIPLSHYLGDEGMGYFNAAYQIYTWLYMLSTAGLPVAVSILISESRAQGDSRRAARIFKITLRLFLILGLVGAAIMLFGARPLSLLIGSPDARYAIVSIAPTLLFVCLSGAVRGYLQGFQQMAPTAFSQVLEALGKLFIGVLGAVYAIRQGFSLPIVAAFSVAGLAVGEAVAFLYLWLARNRYEKKGKLFLLSSDSVVQPQGGQGILPRLFRIALPITASASVLSLTGLIDLVMVQRRLQSIGYTVSAATAFYGSYTTLAVPMFNLPPALIYPITTAIVPLLSATLAAGNRGALDRLIQSAMRVASLISLPCSLGLSLFSRPILRLFFPIEMVEDAAPMLSILALAIFFLSLLTVTNAVLQANDMAKYPMISMLVGGVAKIVAGYVLIGDPNVGTAGVPFSTLLCYIVAVSFNLYFIIRHLHVYPSIGRILVRPAFAALLSVGAARGFYLIAGGDAKTPLLVLPAIIIAVFAYAAAIFLLKAVTLDDLTLIPGYNKIRRFFAKRQTTKEHTT